MKEARKLSRRSERSGRRLFLADGPKAVEGALTVDGCVAEVFATPAATEQYAALADAAAAAGATWTLVDEGALASLSDAVTPAGVIAVCRHVDVPLAQALPVVEQRAPATAPPVVEVRGAPATAAPVVEQRAPASVVETPAPTQGLTQARLVAICADVRDPGNAGTVIRTADAAGADAVVLAGSSVDAYNPKTVRATVGSLFHLPLTMAADPLEAIAAARAAGLVVLAADGEGEIDLDEAEELLAGPTAWLFGNEAWGLPDELAAAADHRVRIPIHGRAESLNLSTAAAVCLYASAREQRRAAR